MVAQNPTNPPPLAPVALPIRAMKQETYALDSGEVLVRWPAALSADDFEDLKGQLEILIRKIGRSVKSDANSKPGT